MKNHSLIVCLFLAGSNLTVFSQKTDPDVFYVPGSSTKICQLIGDYDKHFEQPTQNQTWTNYTLPNTDLGSSFQHNNTTFFLFGDVWLENSDPIAYSNDTDPEDGLELDFIAELPGYFQPLFVPGIMQGGMEVPVEGISVDGQMYIYLVTGWYGTGYERLVVALSDDNGNSFTYLYNFSTYRFMNVSIEKVNVSDWPGLPSQPGEQGLLFFGAGNPYRQSNIRLAFQPTDSVSVKNGIRYLSGVDTINNIPYWSPYEPDAIALFDQPCAAELSISYNTFINKWILLYNCLDTPRGIHFRTADFPWGPWSEEQLIFDPWSDGGYCHFMHTSWSINNCDAVSDAGREYEWGGEYGAYQVDDFTKGTDSTTTIYYTMSTWNPYTVVLMKSSLRKPETNASVNDYPVAKDGLSFSISPNPCKDKIIFETQSNAEVEIVNLQGQLISYLKVNSGITSINISLLPDGMYFTVLKSEKGVVLKKFIKD